MIAEKYSFEIFTEKNSDPEEIEQILPILFHVEEMDKVACIDFANSIYKAVRPLFPSNSFLKVFVQKKYE